MTAGTTKPALTDSRISLAAAEFVWSNPERLLPQPNRAMISILILTKNEEQNLPGCLASVSWSDDIHVYDSHSSDRTVEIAEAAGARVTRRPAGALGGIFFGGNEAEHKNWGIHYIPFKHPWVFHLDADERVTPELAANLQRAAATPGDKVAFRVQRRDFAWGCWLKHVQVSPFYLRLFRPEKMRYARLINPVSTPDGPVGDVSGYLNHFPFSHGVSHWLERHNAYSTLEARQAIQNLRAETAFSIKKAFFARDFHERRFHQKALFYRIPGRPVWKFLLLYFAKRGFLDGRAGLAYAVLQSFYEYLIVLKTRELNNKTCHRDTEAQSNWSISTLN